MKKKKKISKIKKRQKRKNYKSNKKEKNFLNKKRRKFNKRIKFKKKSKKFKKKPILRNKKKNKKKKVSSLKLVKKKKFKFSKINKKIKSILNFRINLNESFNVFFKKIKNKFSRFKKDLEKKREKNRLLKIKAMEKEKVETQKKLIQIEEEGLRARKFQLKEEEKLEKNRKIELQQFIRLEQAELIREQAVKQKKVLEQIKLEKKIERFRRREELEIKNLEKYVLKQQRTSYEEVQERIKKIKEKYEAIRQQKIFEELKERLIRYGVSVNQDDNKEALLEKERIYNEERQKVEFALESFYRSALSLCFQINKRYIPKYLSIMRVIDRRFESGEILIKWDEALDEEWFLLIYVKKDSVDNTVFIEDKTNSGDKIVHQFKPTEIFKASDVMVDALTKLLDSERNKKKVN